MQIETTSLPKSMILKNALLFYGQKNSSECQMTTCHKITHKQGKPVIEAGHIADQNALKRMFAKIKPTSDNLVRNEILPEGTIYKDENKIIWTRKETTARIYFASEDEQDINEKMIRWPNMIFVLTGKSSLHVHTCRSLKNIGENTEILSTPFFNTTEQGAVCMTPKKDNTSLRARIQTMTTGIYEIPFTHASSNSKTQFWLDHIRNNPMKFPYDKMKKIGTIQNLIYRWIK